MFTILLRKLIVLYASRGEKCTWGDGLHSAEKQQQEEVQFGVSNNMYTIVAKQDSNGCII